ncbi:MAG TPA: helix-turn-helix domain-containing protein [Solirubrobacteraceae bacterium]|nr:helix-turn-helix domain-containing protein [Solirubrobacteraceae bacterium]
MSAAPSTDAPLQLRPAGERATNGLAHSGLRTPVGSGDGWPSVVEFDYELDPHPRGWSTPGGKRLVARVAQLPPGRFDPAQLVEDPSGWLGLLVVDGLVHVQVAAGRAPIGWLIGADDLLRPWEMADVSLLTTATWQALSPLRVALLDADFGRRVAGIGSIADTLTAKAAQTSHWLFAKSLVTGTSVIEERLLLLFALLGERWGKATAAGVLVTMPLTHQVLATLVGARRPSVSTALRGLCAAGLLERTTDGWLLCRTEPNGQGRRPRCWSQYAEALGLALS